MQTPINTLNETEAVNRILSTVGGEKVASLTSLSLTADSAYTHLRDSLRDLQGHAWGFNTQKDVELEADGHGEIHFDTKNLATGGPSDMTPGTSGNRWIHSTNIQKGIDGTTGPLGYGHAHHWGNHIDQANTYLLFYFTPEDETYYTYSVYLKYHSATATRVIFWDGEAPTEDQSKIIITWNTDGSIASATTTVEGVESGTDATPLDTTTPPQAAASYESVGKGWYRIVTTVKAELEHFPTALQLKCELQPNQLDTTSYGSTYVWGPQLVKSAYVAPYEQGRYASKFIAAIDFAPENAGNFDVVLRTNEYQSAGIMASASPTFPQLFDRKSNSFNAFSGKYKANITYYLQFEDCPEVVKQYVTALAAKNFQASQVGNPQMDAILGSHILGAKAAFESYEASQESWSIFDSYDVWKIVSPNDRPYIGGGGTRSSWASSLG